MALHLRAMNMLYEAIKEKGSMVIVPSSAVETMGLGGLAGIDSSRRAGRPDVPGGSKPGLRVERLLIGNSCTFCTSLSINSACMASLFQAV